MAKIQVPTDITHLLNIESGTTVQVVKCWNQGNKLSVQLRITTGQQE